MKRLLILTTRFFALDGAQNDICFTMSSRAKPFAYAQDRLREAKDPYEDAIEFVTSKGFSHFGYDAVAFVACPEPCPKLAGGFQSGD
jgi:hypothetical protein